MTVMKESKDYIKRWRNKPCPWIGRINIVKITIWPKVIYRFSIIPIKLPIIFFTELKLKVSQFVWKHKKKTQITKAILNKTNGAGRNQPSWLQTIPQTYSHQESFLLSQKQNYRSMEQDRNPRDKPTYLWKQEYTKEKRQPLRDSVK